MDAVILAAGLGTRIRDLFGVPGKQALRIRGLELFMYPIASLWLNGIDYFHIVTNPVMFEYIDRVMEKYSGLLGYRYELSLNPHRLSGNGYSLIIALKDYLGSRGRREIIVSVSDHIFHPDMPGILIEGLRGEFDIAVLGDHDPRCIDLSEATRINVDENNRIRGIGKNIDVYRYIDTGLFIFRNIDVITGLFDERINLGLKDIVGDRRLFSIVIPCRGDCYWVDIDTPGDLELLEDCPGKPHLETLERLKGSLRGGI